MALILKWRSRLRDAAARGDRLFAFHQFKDCRRGSLAIRKAAYRHNHLNRHLILPYVNRWSQASCFIFLWLKVCSLAQGPIWVEASLGVAFCVGMIATLLQGLAWVMLGLPEG